MFGNQIRRFSIQTRVGIIGPKDALGGAGRGEKDFLSRCVAEGGPQEQLRVRARGLQRIGEVAGRQGQCSTAAASNHVALVPTLVVSRFLGP
jgi:hypothetical protein